MGIQEVIGFPPVGLERHEVQLALCEICSALSTVTWQSVSNRDNDGITTLQTKDEVIARIRFERSGEMLWVSALIRTDLLAKYQSEIFLKHLGPLSLSFEPLRPYLDRSRG